MKHREWKWDNFHTTVESEDYKIMETGVPGHFDLYCKRRQRMIGQSLPSMRAVVDAISGNDDEIDFRESLAAAAYPEGKPIPDRIANAMKFGLA